MENISTICIRGFPINQNAIGKTPLKIPTNDEKIYATKEEVLHFMLSSLIGEIFTWSSIQNGNIINEIIPIKEDENKPISSGANYPLDFHTEDAFHPFAGEYLSLLCMRNPTQTPISLVYTSDLSLTEEIKSVLFQNRFKIGINYAHQLPQIDFLSPILFGRFEDPYIRLNMNNIGVSDGDLEAEMALKSLYQEMKFKQTKFILRSGDFIFIDNFKTIHAREEFHAKYDGADRWLKRLYITNDLRRSRYLRTNAHSRIINILEKPD